MASLFYYYSFKKNLLVKRISSVSKIIHNNNNRYYSSSSFKNLDFSGIVRNHSSSNKNNIQIDLNEQGLQNISEYTPDRVRNFCIIAHIDHGKSTLADRLLELTGTINKSQNNKQVLDKLQVERERGITVKAQTASMIFPYKGTSYLLNLIDTPGHVDFSYEVSRSMAACQGAVLLVDATKGIQAQTVANFFLAFGQNLKIISAINKIDSDSADIQRVQDEMEKSFDSKPNETLKISAKTGLGCIEVMQSVVEKIPSPPISSSSSSSPISSSSSSSLDNNNNNNIQQQSLDNNNNNNNNNIQLQSSFKALLFDSSYDTYVGAICLFYLIEGSLKRGDSVESCTSGKRYEVNEVGIYSPDRQPVVSLHAGHVGYACLGMRVAKEAFIGDTFKSVGDLNTIALPGFRASKPMVFSGIFPITSEDHTKLSESIGKLLINDSSVTMQKETSTLLGQGFRLGFLGTLHMDVFRQRLEQEYSAKVICTMPSVPFKIIYKIKNNNNNNFKIITDPTEFPDPSEIIQQQVLRIEEPIVLATIIVSDKYLSGIIELCQSKRGVQLDVNWIGGGEIEGMSRAVLKYRLPLMEIVHGFFAKIKSISSGYASFDYESAGFMESDLVRMDILLNSQKFEALASIRHKSTVKNIGKETVKKLKDIMERQIVETTIQAAIGKEILSRETVPALRKDVLAKIYGGDFSRKAKLLSQQKDGKKSMKDKYKPTISFETYVKMVKTYE